MAKNSTSGGGPESAFGDPESALDQSTEAEGKRRKQLESVNEAVNRNTYLTQGLQTALQALQVTLQGVSSISQVAHLALDGFSVAVQGVANQIGGLVRLANPGVLDRFQKAFAAFQAQLGQVFLPVLVGLTGLVQTVADALAGLDQPGRAFVAFLAGAVAGIGAAVTVGGVLATVLGTVIGGMVLGTTVAGVLTTTIGALSGTMAGGSVAASGLAAAIDLATAGLAAIGGAIGALLSGGVTVGGAAAGGLGAIALFNGSLEQFKAAFLPFLETLIGAFNSAGAAVLPAVSAALNDILPALNEMFAVLVQYAPLLAEVLASVGTNLLPPLVRILTEVLRAGLPVANVLAKTANHALQAAGALLTLVDALVRLIVQLNNPIIWALSPKVRRQPTGRADSPITSAGYTGVEDLYKRSQEQSVLGVSGQQNKTFNDVMTDKTVIQQWVSAIVTGVVGVMSGQTGGGAANNLFRLLGMSMSRSP